MAIYETTKFSQQKSHSQALLLLRAKINEQTSVLRGLTSFQGQTAIQSLDARNKIIAAAGKPHMANAHVYEVPVSGHWRIFFGQATSGGVIALMFGHLTPANVLQQP